MSHEKNVQNFAVGIHSDYGSAEHVFTEREY
jgi:hypothetical protein